MSHEAVLARASVVLSALDDRAVRAGSFTVVGTVVAGMLGGRVRRGVSGGSSGGVSGRCCGDLGRARSRHIGGSSSRRIRGRRGRGRSGGVADERVVIAVLNDAAL